MMSTLVSFDGDVNRMDEQITWLGIGHIKYGARPQHAKVRGLEDSLKARFDDLWL